MNGHLQMKTLFVYSALEAGLDIIMVTMITHTNEPDPPKRKSRKPRESW